jgi:hypothetical protein
MGAQRIPGDMSKTVKSPEGHVGINLFAFSPFRLFSPGLVPLQLDGC